MKERYLKYKDQVELVNLRKTIKFRLNRNYKAKNYYDWIKKDGYDVHHPFGKWNGYLLVLRKRKDHNHGAIKIYEDPEGDLVECLQNLFKYLDEK